MKIILHFAGTDSVPLDLFENAIDEVRHVVMSQERAELARIRYRVPEISKDLLDAALDNFDKKKAETEIFRISAVKPGSVTLTIVLTAFGYWFLDKTLGDTVTEAWRATDLSKKVKDFFLSGKRDKLESVEREVNKPNRVRLANARRQKKAVEVEIPMYARLDKAREELSIRISFREEEDAEVNTGCPPTWEELE